MADDPADCTLTVADVGYLSVGAALLGSGGGGDPSILRTILELRLRRTQVRLHSDQTLSGAYVVPVGMVGGTSVLAEKLPAGSEFADAARAVSRWAGDPVDAVMGIEAGGVNALTGLLAALDLGLPYLDADLMGRALPRMDQLTWASAGLPVTPAALSQSNRQLILVDGGSPRDLEGTVRTVMAMGGGWAAMAGPPTLVEQAWAGACTGGVARAVRLGRAHAELPTSPSRAQVREVLGARVLGAGRVTDVSRTSGSTRFGRGGVTIVDDQVGTVLRVETENEYLLALADGEVVATCPDLLCLLQSRSAEPLPVDRVRSGDQVVVVTLPGPGWWMRPDRLPVVSPRAFGLDSPPVVEEVH